MSSKGSKTSVRAGKSPATEKLRKAALKEIAERQAANEAAEASQVPASDDIWQVAPNDETAAAPAEKPAKSKTPKVANAEKPAKAPKAVKEPKQLKAAKVKPPKKVSALDAAAMVLAESTTPMRAIDMIAAMTARGLWSSPGGKTPEATLYAAIIREIAAKGETARFKKHDRGLFVAGAAATNEVQP